MLLGMIRGQLIEWCGIYAMYPAATLSVGRTALDLELAFGAVRRRGSKKSADA